GGEVDGDLRPCRRAHRVCRRRQRGGRPEERIVADRLDVGVERQAGTASADAETHRRQGETLPPNSHGAPPDGEACGDGCAEGDSWTCLNTGSGTSLGVLPCSTSISAWNMSSAAPLAANCESRSRMTMVCLPGGNQT